MFTEDIETENGCIADGQERRLISSYLDNFEDSPACVKVSYDLDPETNELLDSFCSNYGISRLALETAVSKWLCDPMHHTAFFNMLNNIIRDFGRPDALSADKAEEDTGHNS